MDKDLITAVVSILTAIVGLATLSAVLSKNARTVDVIKAGGSAYSQILSTALSPITGGGNSLTVNSNLGF